MMTSVPGADGDEHVGKPQRVGRYRCRSGRCAVEQHAGHGQVDRHDDQHHGQAEIDDQHPGLATGPILMLEEVHRELPLSQRVEQMPVLASRRLRDADRRILQRSRSELHLDALRAARAPKPGTTRPAENRRSRPRGCWETLRGPCCRSSRRRCRPGGRRRSCSPCWSALPARRACSGWPSDRDSSPSGPGSGSSCRPERVSAADRPCMACGLPGLAAAC